jgi:hypothetical protein
LDPWARDHHNDPDRIALLCRAHNQRAAEVDFGLALMEERRGVVTRADCPRGQLPHSAAELGKEADG